MSSEKHLRYHFEVGPLEFPAREVRGKERIFEPFHFEIRVALPVTFDPDEIIWKEASLSMVREGVVRTVHGLVTDAWVGGSTRGMHEAVFILEPRLALMRLRQDIRLFRNKDAVEIVLEVLAGHGIVPEKRLAGSYAKRPYCVQSRETDLDFVHRLLEDEGIHYFFREDGGMVLGDSTAAYDKISGIPVLPFRPGSGLDHDEECITEIGAEARFLAGKVTLRDFNAEHPRLDMDVMAEGPTPVGPEYYDYPGEYELPAEGQKKVSKMGEALACAAQELEGQSFSARLLPGHTVTLLGAPPGIADGEIVLTEVLHDFHVTQSGFAVAFEALPASVSFVPARVTPPPVLTDPLTGFITGPPGEDIHCDEYGRVKVHFHWDRLFPYDDNCSHWIPVLQDNTGHSMSIPRIGWEVAVHFLEGDPDRPVVLGRVYNPLDPPHLLLPLNKTRSTIKTLTSPRSPNRDDSGTNEIYFDDIAGIEFIQYLAEKDQNVVIANDKTETVLLNEQDVVERDERIAIGVDHTATIGSTTSGTVKQNQDWTVGGNRDISVAEADQTTVLGNHSMSIGGMHFRRIAQDDTSMAQKKNTELVGGVVLEASMKDNTNYGTKLSTLVVGGAHVEIAKENKNEGVGRARAEVIGGAVIVNAGGEIGLRADKKRATTVGGTLSVTAAKEMTLVGVEKLQTQSATAAFESPSGILFKVGETQVLMKDGAIELDAGTEIKLTVTGKNEQGAGTASQN